MEGLDWLKQNNNLYKDVDKDYNWEKTSHEEDEYLGDKLTALQMAMMMQHWTVKSGVIRVMTVQKKTSVEDLL